MPEIILLNVRWYCRYALSYRNLEEMMAERGVDVDHSTLRQVKYLNNLIEQDHRNIKRITKLALRFKSFNSARRTLSGIEAMDMICQGQVNGIDRGDVVSQVSFIEAILGIAI